MGFRLGVYLEYDPAGDQPLNEENEDRWVSAMGHASTVIQFWGMILPFFAWMSEKDRSKHLRFQSLQALIFQAIAMLILFIGAFIYLFLAIAIMLKVTA
jgi:uncharacterized Tic20 family protein